MFSHIVRQWVTLSFFVVACSFFLRQGQEHQVQLLAAALCYVNLYVYPSLSIISVQCKSCRELNNRAELNMCAEGHYGTREVIATHVKHLEAKTQ